MLLWHIRNEVNQLTGTVCAEKVGDFVYYGFSKVSRKDNFARKVGRQIAIERMRSKRFAIQHKYVRLIKNSNNILYGIDNIAVPSQNQLIRCIQLVALGKPPRNIFGRIAYEFRKYRLIY